MALVFPRDMTTGRSWAEPTLALRFRQELSRNAGGVMQAKDMGPAIWSARFRSIGLPLVEAHALMVDFQTLRDALFSFYLHPADRPLPASIATAAPLSGYTVAVAAIGTNNDTLTLDGLPAGFVLTAGDYLSIETSASGLAFLRLAEGGAANGSGVSPALAVTPHVLPSVAVDDEVTLVNPLVEMRLVPGSLDDPMVLPNRRQIVFEAMQVIGS